MSFVQWSVFLVMLKEVYDVIFSCIDAGKTCIDFTTSSPKLAKELYTKGKELGVHVLDAPVTGGDTGAKMVL